MGVRRPPAVALPRRSEGEATTVKLPRKQHVRWRSRGPRPAVGNRYTRPRLPPEPVPIAKPDQARLIMRRPAKGENSLNELLIVVAILRAPLFLKPERESATPAHQESGAGPT